MMNTIMNLEYKLDLRYFLDRVLSFKRSLMLVLFVCLFDYCHISIEMSKALKNRQVLRYFVIIIMERERKKR